MNYRKKYCAWGEKNIVFREALSLVAEHRLYLQY